jgi:glycosyltransferase involved in cell wall biosynthesis
MKIVHLCNYIQPKLGYQEYYLAKEHARMGHEVTVVTSDRYYPFPDYEKTVKKVLGERIIGCKEEFIDGFKIIRLGVLIEIGTQVILKGLTKTIKKINPEVVICHEIGQFNSFKIARLKKGLNFRLIYDSHGSFICDSKNFIKNFYYNKMLNYSIIKKNADKIIGVTQECVNYIIKKFRIPEDMPIMIPLGSDVDVFKKDKQKGNEIRKKYSVSDKDFVIIFTGKILEKKGVHLIIEAISKIKKINNITFIAVGDGNVDYCNRLKTMAQNENLRFIKIDAVPNKDLVDYYSAADLAVWPVEATIGTIDAMACGLPIICAKFLKERYEAGNGFGVKEWDLDELTEKIQYFIDNPDKTKTMAELSKKVVDERFSWKVIAKKFLE